VAGLFLVMGVVILARQWLMPGLEDRFDPLRMNLGGVLALVLAGVNLARWYTLRSFMKERRTAVRYPLQRDPSAAPQVEPIPEFDFTKRSDEEDAGPNEQSETENRRNPSSDNG